MGAQVSFMLTESDKGVFDAIARYYGITKTELLKRWIYAEGRDILTPLVNEAIRLGIGEEDQLDPVVSNIRKMEVQQFMETAEVGGIMVGFLDDGHQGAS